MLVGAGAQVADVRPLVRLHVVRRRCRRRRCCRRRPGLQRQTGAGERRRGETGTGEGCRGRGELVAPADGRTWLSQEEERTMLKTKYSTYETSFYPCEAKNVSRCHKLSASNMRTCISMGLYTSQHTAFLVFKHIFHQFLALYKPNTY